MRFNGTEVTVQFSKYYDGNLAVLMKDAEDGSPYGTISVNLEEGPSNEKCAYVDINNMGAGVIDFIENNKLGKFTGRYGMSGFCTYPEFEFEVKEEE